MVVSNKVKPKEVPSPSAPSAHHTHTSKKIAEMIIAMVVVLLLISMGLFITQIYSLRGNTVVNNFYYGTMSMAQQTTTQQAFQQVTAPAGQAVAGYPKALIPAHGTITASYHTQYNGYDQYTLMLNANSTLANEYAAFQQFINAQQFKITQKTASSTEDTINAQKGMDYITVQLMPQRSSTTAVTINYGTPIQ